jgi:hypothetical protein
MTIGYACEKMGQVVVLARCRILLRHLRAYRGIERGGGTNRYSFE